MRFVVQSIIEAMIFFLALGFTFSAERYAQKSQWPEALRSALFVLIWLAMFVVHCLRGGIRVYE